MKACLLITILGAFVMAECHTTLEFKDAGELVSYVEAVKKSHVVDCLKLAKSFLSKCEDSILDTDSLDLLDLRRELRTLLGVITRSFDEGDAEDEERDQGELLADVRRLMDSWTENGAWLELLEKNGLAVFRIDRDSRYTLFVENVTAAYKQFIDGLSANGRIVHNQFIKWFDETYKGINRDLKYETYHEGLEILTKTE